MGPGAGLAGAIGLLASVWQCLEPPYDNSAGASRVPRATAPASSDFSLLEIRAPEAPPARPALAHLAFAEPVHAARLGNSAAAALAVAADACLSLSASSVALRCDETGAVSVLRFPGPRCVGQPVVAAPSRCAPVRARCDFVTEESDLLSRVASCRALAGGSAWLLIDGEPAGPEAWLLRPAPDDCPSATGARASPTGAMTAAAAPPLPLPHAGPSTLQASPSGGGGARPGSSRRTVGGVWMQRGFDLARSDAFPAPSMPRASLRWATPRGAVGSQIQGGAALVPGLAPDGGDVLVFGASDFKVHAVHADTGEVLWQTATAHEVKAPVAVASTLGDASLRVYAASHHTLLALNASDGSVLWNGTTAGTISLSGPVPVPALGIVLVGRHGSRVVAFDDGDGSVAWQQATTHATVDTTGLLSEDGAVAYYAANGGPYGGHYVQSSVHAVRLGAGNDTGAGRVLWTVEGQLGQVLPKMSRSRDGRHLFLTARSIQSNQPGRVMCLRAADGAELWSADVAGDLGRSAVGPPAVVSDAATGRALRVFVHSNTRLNTVLARLEVFALNATDGALLWTYTGESTEDISVYDTGPVATSDDRVYVPSNEGSVLLLDALTGRLIWRLHYSDLFEVPTAVTAPIVLHSRTGAPASMFVGYADAQLRRFDPVAVSGGGAARPTSAAFAFVAALAVVALGL